MKVTCEICRRHRKIMANRRVCLACAVGITHACPICQHSVPGTGQAHCYPCNQRRRAQRQIAAEAATIPHPWLAELFTPSAPAGASR